MKDSQIWGCVRAYARTHPQIWPFLTLIPKEPRWAQKIKVLELNAKPAILAGLLAATDRYSLSYERAGMERQFPEPRTERRSLVAYLRKE